MHPFVIVVLSILGLAVVASLSLMIIMIIDTNRASKMRREWMRKNREECARLINSL